MKNNKRTWREKLGIFLIIIGTAVFLLYLFAMYLSGYLNSTFSIDLAKASDVGAFIGGVSGSMWALGGILFLYETLYSQRNEFEENRRNYLSAQKEATYFRYLSQLNEIIRFLSGELINDKDNKIYVGRSYLHKIYESFKVEHKSKVGSKVMNLGIRNAIKEVQKSNHKEVQVKFDNITLGDLEKTIISTYESFYANYHYNLGHFYRFVYHIVKYIIDNYESDNDRHKYLGILQAQLSNDELGLLFFNCISKYSMNSKGLHKFHEWIDKYQLLQNIDVQNIIFAEYIDFYPETKFKFITINKTK